MCDKIMQLAAAHGEASEARALLDAARREASEAINSAERLNEECRGLRGIFTSKYPWLLRGMMLLAN